jgi:hypothetical protein
MINQQLTWLSGAGKVRAIQMFHSQKRGTFFQEELLTLFLLFPLLQLSSVRVVAGGMLFQRTVKAIVCATGVKRSVCQDSNSNEDRNNIRVARGDFTVRMDT